MLSRDLIAELAEIFSTVQADLIEAMSEGRSTEEPDMTSRLLQSLETRLGQLSGVSVFSRTVDSAGPGASESRIGADLCGVLRVDRDGIIATKGFLAQAKRPGRDGLTFLPASGNAKSESYWLYRGDLWLEQSGIVRVARPSARLAQQCSSMLAYTPDSFVFVYSPDQVAVVSASAVLACRSKPNRQYTELGTKTFEDFFVHFLDCFIGDPMIRSWDNSTLEDVRAQRNARYAVQISIVDV